MAASGTHRFDATGFTELGASLIPAGDGLTRRYVSHFGLRLRVNTAAVAGYHIDGGMDLLPAMFAKALAAPVRTGWEVVSIEQSAGAAAAIARRGGDYSRFEADLMIVTLPATILRRIHVSPALSPAKIEALHQVSYTSATRVARRAGAQPVRWSWDEHRYSCGAVCQYQPGQHERVVARLTEPEGRILLAGEHTSLRPGTMQGAIESGLRAAHQVVAR